MTAVGCRKSANFGGGSNLWGQGVTPRTAKFQKMHKKCAKKVHAAA